MKELNKPLSSFDFGCGLHLSADMSSQPVAVYMRELNKLLMFSLCLFSFIFFSQGYTGNAFACQPERIVSLAPSITETLFALGLGDRIAGVTRFCTYPPEARSKPHIGGYYDPNYEAITALGPDLVVLLNAHVAAQQNLARLGVPTLAVNHKDIDGILDGILTLGKYCGAQKKSVAMVHDLKTRMQKIRDRVKTLQTPRVLVCVGRNMGNAALGDVYIAGNKSLYNQFIQLSGAVNAYTGPGAYPKVSAEGLLHINADIIIDLLPDIREKKDGRERVIRQWQGVPGLNAVKKGRLYILAQDYAVIPGPRFILLLEQMAQLIHPALDKKQIKNK